jgi:hypothetical protein
MEGVELSKVKYTHSRGTSRNPFEHGFGINMKGRIVK